MCGRQAAPWHVPVPASVARLTSSRSWNPRSQTEARSATVVPVHGQTTPSVGAGGSPPGGGRVPDDADREPRALPGEPVARVQPEIEHDGVRLVPALGAVAAAHDDRPDTVVVPSKRTGCAPSSDPHRDPAGSRPAAVSTSAARAV